ncbi:serine/threonine protein kinase [Mycobacterium kubicae]|uniref:serine/threonine-protein kinase n=1 Tax=Mycobacterium kubicae TaxID=120959 RepID=UPI00163FC91E|nr:serine/threonine-protein kinase [Mycobacterium kubicae]QNI06125.1 serine/threonine protein kinase [Mycobacterium kubicae]
MPIVDGAVFAGYTILRLLGTGGMGEVYLVQHPRLPRREALKILPGSVSADPEYRQRFAREADIAASLWHPHVVAIHDRGEYEGQLWIAMDYVEGTDAAQLLRRRYPSGMPPEDVLEIVAAVADALDYAHKQGLFHRDVKPANILIANPRSDSRRIMLTDFGIARATDDISGLTATNMTVGSFAYAAPEQLTGKKLDGRADQYALACTAYQLLTGELPFPNSNPAVVIGNHLSSKPPRLARLRPELGLFDDVLSKAMAKEPFRRFRSCREFADALAQSFAELDKSADTTQLATPVQTPPPSATHRQGLLIAGCVAALLAVGIVAFIATRLAQPPSPPASAPQQAPLSTEVYAPRPPETITFTPPPLTVTQPGAPPNVSAAPPSTTSSRSDRGAGDLGLTTPIAKPNCNGQGIVVLGSVTTPGLYAVGVQRLLDAHPGSYYLRTDQTCPSLRPTTDEGNPIYAVFIPGGTTQSAVCARVRAAGGNAYGKWLDFTTDPGYVIPC